MVYSANRFLNRAEMTVNAQYILNYFLGKGWTKEAICGMLGNQETESTINPGIWQSLNEGNLSGGFGLVQWTPATKYTDWADARSLVWEEMDSNLKRIEYELLNSLQWITTSEYPLTFQQFSESILSPTFLANTFLNNYERPAESVQPARGEQAEAWYTALTGEVTPPSDEPFPSEGPLPRYAIYQPWQYRLNLMFKNPAKLKKARFTIWTGK